MKELGFTLNDFTKGLRLRDNGRRNDDTLTSCFNLVPRPEGLVSPTIISEPITAISASHPFPQIFFGDSFWLLCTEDKIYTINSDWTVTLALDVSVYYGVFPSAPKGTWHFVDHFSFVILTNGGVTVLFNPDTGIWEFNDGSTVPTIGSVASYNGQLLGLGVTAISGDPKTVFQGTDNRYLMWGGIGVADFTIDKSNTRGNRPLVGEQYKIMILGDHIVVYGARKVSILKPSGSNYSLVRSYNYGIASREAVGGNDKNHVFIDTFGNLYRIGTDLKVIGPNYKEFFSPMLGNEIVVQHCELYNEFYITDGVVSYCLTDIGLGEISKGYTGVGILGAIIVGIATDFNDSSGYITSEILDFGTKARKTTTVVEVGCVNADTVYVAIESRHNSMDVFESSDWVELNPVGAAAIKNNGIEFKVKIKCDTAIGFKPDYVIIRAEFDDKRFIRGKTNAGTTYRGTGE